MQFQTIADLAPLAHTLNEESNNINKAISAANSRLAELRLGTEVWASENLSSHDYGFACITGTWQLAVRWRAREKNPNHKFGVEYVWAFDALSKRNREQRLDGLRALPRIVYLLKKEVEWKIATIRQVNDLASAVVSSGAPAGLLTGGEQSTVTNRPGKARHNEAVN